MKILTEKEVEQVNGGWSADFGDALEGSLFGFGDGMATGMLIGGAYGGSSGGGVLGFGLIGSLVGMVIGGVVGGGYGLIGGFALGRDDIQTSIADYRDKYRA
ncbi:MAG: colicin V synthesis protein [Limnobaculum xujianqingii]